MSPILNKIKKSIYIFKYILITSWTGKLENINGRVIKDLNHLLRLNDVRAALGYEPVEKDLYFTVRR